MRIVVALLAAAAVLSWSPRRRRRLRPVVSSADAAGELVALGLSAGMSFGAALEAAAEHLRGPIAADVRSVLRKARRRGMGEALSREPRAVSGLFRVAHRAVVTGAPLLPAVEGWTREIRKAERARRAEAVQALPVRLLLPLTLLTLPGFVVLTVGPTLLEAVSRLGA